MQSPAYLARDGLAIAGLHIPGLGTGTVSRASLGGIRQSQLCPDPLGDLSGTCSSDCADRCKLAMDEGVGWPQSEAAHTAEFKHDPHWRNPWAPREPSTHIRV